MAVGPMVACVLVLAHFLYVPYLCHRAAHNKSGNGGLGTYL